MEASALLLDRKARLLNFYKRNETKLDILFFVGGFAFDSLMATEIGEPFSVFQQIIYLFIIASLLHFEVLFRNGVWLPTGRKEKLWQYRGLPLHFFLGTLLNIYSLFYIKSASLFNSISFLVVLIGVILANELPVVKRSHVSFKVAMYAVCLFSFISMMFPFLLGFVGWIPFGLSLVTTLCLFHFQLRRLKKSIPSDRILFQSWIAPVAGVLGLFTLFYFLGLIPPVPLSVEEQGIYHDVQKRDGRYYLSQETQNWNFFGLGRFGNEEFHTQPGDKIYFYAQIFSPSRFSDKVYVQWSFKDPRLGWQTQDKIPLSISGGRREGFRGYTSKSNYQAGNWRVQVLSADGQEMSRMYFDVISVESTPERTFHVLTR